jgi:CheY-like chemotaxis protein
VKEDHTSFEELNKKQFCLILTDLNMPISNGYETCKNIWNLYNEKSIFKTVKRKSGISQTCSDGKNDILMIQMRPLIVAWTSENLSNKKLMDKLTECGFDLMMESPITNKHI